MSKKESAVEQAIDALDLVIRMNAARTFSGYLVAADEQLPFVAKSMRALSALRAEQSLEKHHE